MILNLSYPMEKMTKAVSMMATHQGGIKNRLCQAHGEFHTIGPDMPEPFREDYEWIVHELTKVSGDDEGAIVATLEAMTDEHAVKIANCIVDLAFQITRGYWHQPFEDA